MSTNHEIDLGTNPVIQAICTNLRNFNTRVKEAGMRMNPATGECCNLIRTGHTVIKMVPNSSGTAYTTTIDTDLARGLFERPGARYEEFIRAYVSVLYLLTVLSDEDIEDIKAAKFYNKNGIVTVPDRKGDSLYVTIFDNNNRSGTNLLQ